MLYENNPNKGKLKFMGLSLKRRDACDYLKDVYALENYDNYKYNPILISQVNKQYNYDLPSYIIDNISSLTKLDNNFNTEDYNSTRILNNSAYYIETLKILDYLIANSTITTTHVSYMNSFLANSVIYTDYILNCENNQLRSLDLRGLNKLNVLNCSYNKLTIIENLPENISDFNYDNNPSIEFRNSNKIPNGKTTKQEDEEHSILQQIGYEDSLKYYFSLKSTYENSLLESKQKIFYTSPTKKIARQKILQLNKKSSGFFSVAMHILIKS
jgi:hypothetical protein